MESLRLCLECEIFFSLSMLLERSSKHPDLCRGGMIAPLLGGVLLTMSPSIPVYTSAVIFVVAGLCVVLLEEDHEHGRRKSGRAIVH